MGGRRMPDRSIDRLERLSARWTNSIVDRPLRSFHSLFDRVALLDGAVADHAPAVAAAACAAACAAAAPITAGTATPATASEATPTPWPAISFCQSIRRVSGSRQYM